MYQSRRFSNDGSTDSGGGDSCSSGSVSPISPTHYSPSPKHLLPIIQQQFSNRKCSPSKLKFSNKMGGNSLHLRLPIRWPLTRLINPKCFSLLITAVLLLAIWRVWLWNEQIKQLTTVILITPTNRRPERIADMTRQTIYFNSFKRPLFRKILCNTYLIFEVIWGAGQLAASPTRRRAITLLINVGSCRL